MNLASSFCLCPCRNIYENNDGPHRAKLRILENSFESLSEEEKDRAYSDLYGLEQPMKESPEFVRQKLEDLNMEMERLNKRMKPAYVQALIAMERNKRLQQQQNCTNSKNEDNNDELQECDYYVYSDKFRLMFLRAERFDVCKAALRLIKYLNSKLELFGSTDILTRKIRQSDLTYQDQAVLVSGFYSFLNDTDFAGRPILICRRQFMFGQNVTSLQRALFYLTQLILDDNEEAQKKGIVGIVYNIGQQPNVGASQFRMYAPFFRTCAHALPYKIAGFHIFYSDLKEHILLNFIVVIFPKSVRSRFCCHFTESKEECLFHLLAYGINSPNVLPFSDMGEFQEDRVWHHLESQRQLEECQYQEQQQQRQQQQQQQQEFGNQATNHCMTQEMGSDDVFS